MSGEAFTGPQYYPWSTDAAVDYVNELYISGESADFERNYFPSEKDIRRLATLQLKKIFLDRDISVSSLKSDDEGTTTPPIEEITDEKESSAPRRPTDRSVRLSPEKTQSYLQSVLDEHAMSPPRDPGSSIVTDVTKSEVENLPSVMDGPRNVEDVKHLDLAITTRRILDHHLLSYGIAISTRKVYQALRLIEIWPQNILLRSS